MGVKVNPIPKKKEEGSQLMEGGEGGKTVLQSNIHSAKLYSIKN